MPTYDYVCQKCDHEFEEFQSITARPLKKCPRCGQRKLQRLIGTGGGVIFKGSGFYQTDYRSEAYKKAAEAEKSARKDTAKAPADSKAKGEKKGKKPPDSSSTESKTSSSESSSKRKAG